MRFYLLSLGCPKNTVDSEGISRLLQQAGHEAITEPESAQLLIVNTCGFIDKAKEESFAALRELAELEQPGQFLIAAGCLSQRYGRELATKVPSLDGVIGTRRWMEITTLVRNLRSKDYPRGKPAVMTGDPLEGIAEPMRGALRGASAYLKIADGCSAPCAFCAIPAIKGPARSRPLEAIVTEAQQLVGRGAREIILIAQDTTAYGRDRGERDALPTLMGAILTAAPDLQWLRLMYAYPQHVTSHLIEVMARHPRVCHYLDMPLQHGHPEVLRRMNRPHDVDEVRRLVADLRETMPDIALRTSFIVGYPGETEEEFSALLDFVAEMAFDRVGVFTYSPEEGTRAAELPCQVPTKVREERYARLMELQQGISLARNQQVVGRVLKVLVEGQSEGLSVGRSYRDAPEIDGLVIIEGELPVGEMVLVRITGAMEYDLVGEPVSPVPQSPLFHHCCGTGGTGVA
ncbi:MAG: 30S ribosomal protein S12 methylthiotransferase RimO [Anaerolineales bacterium]|nr:MAG: 30S ribosomal protein S12 methylthiotransferase RimO [Anaerolineales bacterium]